MLSTGQSHCMIIPSDNRRNDCLFRDALYWLWCRQIICWANSKLPIPIISKGKKIIGFSPCWLLGTFDKEYRKNVPNTPNPAFSLIKDNNCSSCSTCSRRHFLTLLGTLNVLMIPVWHSSRYKPILAVFWQSKIITKLCIKITLFAQKNNWINQHVCLNEKLRWRLCLHLCHKFLLFLSKLGYVFHQQRHRQSDLPPMAHSAAMSGSFVSLYHSIPIYIVDDQSKCMRSPHVYMEKLTKGASEKSKNFILSATTVTPDKGIILRYFCTQR